MDPSQIQNLLTRSETDIENLLTLVKPIIDRVKTDGDAALVDFNGQFDKVVMSTSQLKASEEEFEQARRNLPDDVKKVIEKAAANIRSFHEAQMPDAMWFKEIQPGIMAGEKISPIPSVGLYVPRGKGSFPSVMLMLGLPAVIARVGKIIVCTPPAPGGATDDATLYAAELCGIRDVYKTGGAQAIAAMAYGTETIPKVCKTIGPGSSYVSAAKRLLYSKIDVGAPAGPSESIILCDEHANPHTAALDLLIEAEHGTDSTAMLVTHDRQLAERVLELLPALINDLPENRRNFCQHVLSNYGGVVLTSSLAASVAFVNDFAPEHLEVMTQDPLFVANDIHNAGEILLGAHTPITIGNFALGVNAILPTGGFAKTFSCVTVFDFLKRSSIGWLNQHGYNQIKETALRFAQYEGFAAHAAAISKRTP
ncbi:MAG: histidinol dehydrogenase [Magnetococcales bacterium]|nr:histidinol dehydrogenase [Magnetococcales bacterium]MBF0437880.1 histidinol dehydrogenase [Magnetococcales bacterium]